MHAMRDSAKGHLLKESVNSQELARRLANATEHQGLSCYSGFRAIIAHVLEGK
jgi:hypothetical protein